jgi:replicative DNA helicase
VPSDWEPHGKTFSRDLRNQRPAARYPTGLGRLDDVLAGGLHEGQFIVVAACPGGAKSSFGECISLHIAQTEPVLFVPIEMGKARTIHRLSAKLHRSSLDDFCKYVNSEDVHWRAQAENALRRLDTLQLGILEPVNDAEATVNYIFGEAVACGARVLVIDHAREITGWMPTNGGGNAYVNQTLITKQIRDLARKHRIATVLMQQIDKKHDNKRPTSGLIQDTSALAQKADVVILLHLPYKKDKKRNHVVELVVDKNRNGPESLVHLHWTPTTMTMHIMTQAEEEDALCCRRSKHAEEELDARFG